LLCLVGLAVSSVHAASAGLPISVQDAQRAAQAFIESITAYSAAHPGAPATVLEWTGGHAGTPVLVHGYAGLDPAYYLVPVALEDRGVLGAIGMDPSSGQVWWYSPVQDPRGLFTVDREAARSAVTTQYGFTPAAEDALVVTMPNKRIYWLFRAQQMDGAHEYFVSVTDPADVHSDADRDEAGLTTPFDSRGPSPPPEALEPAPAPAPAAPLLFPSSYDISSIPHHYQGTSYHCGPASDEMVFDYWGPDINQTDIGSVANCKNWGSWWGTYYDDNRRAAHFSSNSTALLNPGLRGYRERALGYGALDVFWSYPGTTDPDYPDRYNDLKTLVSSDAPVYILTHYDSTQSSGHFRVVKGYNDLTSPAVFIVHDPWYSPPYYGPNVNFEQTFLVDNLWTRWYRWGAHFAPWKVGVSLPASFACCATITVTAAVEYRGPHPFAGQFVASSPQATISLPAGFTLAAGENATKSIPGVGASGTAGNVSWQVVSPCVGATGVFTVEAKGLVTGSSTSYPSYSDWIGGSGSANAQGGSAEACDAVDNDCDGSIDEDFVIPGHVTGLKGLADRVTLRWTAEPVADRYDVVRGGLAALRTSGGDFQTSLSACTENDSPDAQSLDGFVPAAGNGSYYLVRAQRACRSGTYNDGVAGQHHDRDAGVAASAAHCP
jgi:hypothetical protein